MESYILTQKPFDSSGFRAEGTLIPASVVPHIGVKTERKKKFQLLQDRTVTKFQLLRDRLLDRIVTTDSYRRLN